MQFTIYMNWEAEVQQMTVYFFFFIIIIFPKKNKTAFCVNCLLSG